MAETLELGAKIGVGRTAEIFAASDNRAVKLFYRGSGDTLAQAEASCSALVAKAELPTPGFYGLVEIEDRIGIVYERLEGETMLARVTRRPL